MQFVDETTGLYIGLDQIMLRLHPLSPYGKRAKAKMKAFTPGCEEQVRREWSLLVTLLREWSEQGGAFANLEEILSTFRDIRAIVKKACQEYVLEDVELFEVKRFLDIARNLMDCTGTMTWLSAANVTPPFPESLHATLAMGGSSSFYLDDRFAPGLAELRQSSRKLKAALSLGRKEIRDRIVRETGQGFNHLGRLKISKLDGEVLRILGKHPDLALASETYTEVEFAVRDNAVLIEQGQLIAEYEEKITALEHLARKGLSRMTAESSRLLLAACRRLGRLDLLLAKARLARETQGCMPELTDKGIELGDFVNPVVSECLIAQNLSFQALSLCLETPVTVITGANMGGKSVALKSVGLAVAMAQMGLLVPARIFKFSLRAFIYCSQQDENLGQGLSTFGTEIQSLAGVLPQREMRGLYLLDEPARGTNPWEGSALVKALVKWLKAGNSMTLVATHFPGLSALEEVTHLQVAGLAAANPEQFNKLGADGVKSLHKLMDYSLVPGKGDIPRDALKVAAFLGLAPEILETASQELGSLPREVLKE